VIPPAQVLTRQFSVGIINEFCFYIPMKFLRTTVLTISLLAFLSVPALAQTKIGTVDLRKLFDGYWKKKQAEAALNDRKAQLDTDDKSMHDDLKKGGEEYQKLLEQANDQALSADQRDKRKQAAADKLKQLQDSKAAIDQFERQAQITLSEQSQRMRENLLVEIKAAVMAKAKAAGYSLVIDATADTASAPTAVVYSSGENDLTDDVLKRLNEGAPIDLTKPVASTAVPSLTGTNSPKKINSR
jgi:Skp family chaperone for outer membrane proteins